jgi:hypothetical protein
MEQMMAKIPIKPFTHSLGAMRDRDGVWRLDVDDDALRAAGWARASEVAETLARSADWEEMRHEIELMRAQRDAYHAALTELVDLKALKDDAHIVEMDDPRVDDYRHRKPRAWAKAREVLGMLSHQPSHPPSEKEGPSDG